MLTSMIATVLVMAAAAAAAIEVPYLPQTDALCGGAATAMVFRYWGDVHADAQQFEPLVDKRAGGISGDSLVSAVRARGWRAENFEGSIEELANRLAARQPVIVLIGDRGSRYHYVVVTGLDDRSVVVHDPAWGPARSMERTRFARLWERSRFWSLVVLPAAGVRMTQFTPEPRLGPASLRNTACEALLARAIADIRGPAGSREEAGSDLDNAERILEDVRRQCPQSAGPLRELAGVRFAQRRWDDAAALAREVLVRDRADGYALDVLGSSLFMQDDPVGALRAWNSIGKPRLDSVRIEGIHHARYQAVVEALGLQPNTVLTSDAFARLSRRIGELPDQSSSRLGLRPDADGYASLDVVIAERGIVPRTWPDLGSAVVRAGVDREVSVALPGFSGQGEVWSIDWRWWNNRPRASLALEVPRPAGLFGVWRVEGSWETETYTTDPLARGTSAGAGFVRQSRAHDGLTISDWLSGGVRYAMSAGFDAWSGGPHAASFGMSIERRWFADRVRMTADATTWLPVSNEAGFQTAGARLIVRSNDRRAWRYETALGARRASDQAPPMLWPGAGEGRARGPLLRAHPLLDDGAIDAASHSAYGRSLIYGSAEAQRWLGRPRLARAGFAAFIDMARASRRPTGAAPGQVDLGMGVRLRLAGGRVVRLDAAHGIRDGRNALTLGWAWSFDRP
jgi:hypothetical protein